MCHAISCLLLDHLPGSVMSSRKAASVPVLPAEWHGVGIQSLFVGRMNEAVSDGIPWVQGQPQDEVIGRLAHDLPQMEWLAF